jgi:branched-chain amino acid transport system ATP-binding protein
MLQVEGLHASYGHAEVLHGVNLAVAAGETVAVIGPNGAGKSTLLHVISGVVKPRSGRVLFRDRDITRWPPDRIVRTGIAQVVEGRGILQRLTVRENLLLGSWTIKERAQVAQRLDGNLARFPVLAQRLHQLGGSLSGGEQQQLAIARALMGGPALLLLDEPSLGLAPLILAEVYRLLDEIRQEGTTILLVEQNANKALRFAARAYVLESGTIALSGRAVDLRGNEQVIKAYLA